MTVLASVLRPEIDLGSPLFRSKISSNLYETIRLVEALPNVLVNKTLSVKLKHPSPATLFGKGFIQEFKMKLKEYTANLIVIDGSLSPVQQRNLEKYWELKVIDRTALILEIFGDRAATREGVLQVELAHLSYQKSRLVRSWTHLERQRGGKGFLGGPGETQIESDKRAIDKRVQQIRKSLNKVVKTRGLHRNKRKKAPYPVVSLVGYTNAGKSSVFNRLTGSEVFVKNMLFATLDPKMKGKQLSSGQKIIFSDTVGFISNLPTLLIAAFRATLEEVSTSDLILHVRDISSENFNEQGLAVEEVLHELGFNRDRIPIIEVLNKADKLTLPISKPDSPNGFNIFQRK